eukprot:TRINITY_DN23960_c0_g2_i1.p1 TRINITY_DN23960_c0_g2~~TRINITY_DN23960_c0_g2_i1.p1  ORF type:complete len:251 (-),score=32.27 TRINITY_DN23960_c0_g2_i1:26-778(-)
MDGCDGLQSAVIGAMSGGLSGWTITHGDLGAFTMIDRFSWLPLPGIHYLRDSVLMVRWLELGVFLNAIYRSHPGLIPGKASQPWDSDIVNHTRQLTQLFRDLSPYRDALFEGASLTGLPLVRHGLLVHPEDTSWFNASRNFGYSFRCQAGNEIGLSQFFFGDHVIVVPALHEDQKSVYVYLPRGTWVHFWTRQEVTGPSYNMWAAPLGQPVFFFRTSGTPDVGHWADFFHKLALKYAVASRQFISRAIVI